MTSTEMKKEFLILYDKITNFDAPGYKDSEIETFLNKAQERYILRILDVLGDKYRQGFEATEIRRKGLSELLKSVTLTTADVSANQAGVMENGTFFDLPTDFLFAMQEHAFIASTDDCIDGDRTKIKPVTHDEYNSSVNNPFKKPYEGLIWRLDIESDGGIKRHELVCSSDFTVSEYHLRYLKQPANIVIGTQDCELNSITHRSIIDEAVSIAAGVTDPETYQIKINEQQRSE
jgi:hypothetical protein